MKRLFKKPLVSLLLSAAMLIPTGLVGVHAADNVTLSNYGQWVYSDVQVSNGGGRIALLSDSEKQKVADEINKIQPVYSETEYKNVNSNAIYIGQTKYWDHYYQSEDKDRPEDVTDVYVSKNTANFAYKVNGIKSGAVTVKLNLPNDDFWVDGFGTFKTPKGYYALVMQYNDANQTWTDDQVALIDDNMNITFNYEQSDIVLVMAIGEAKYESSFGEGTFKGQFIGYTQYIDVEPQFTIVNVNTEPSQELMVYNDVNPNTPHIENIEWMSTSGVSKGWDDGTFRPMDTVKRQDMAAFLRREAIRLGVEGAETWKPSAEDWKRFKDVNQDTPHAEDILWLASTGITTGYEDGTYQGMWPVYRQDMAAFLHRLAKTAGFDKTGTKSFTDVTASTPHAEDISWLGGTGISTGYADGTYQGMWPVYRQDMAAFINRLDNFKN